MDLTSRSLMMASAVEEADSGNIQFVGSTYLRKSSLLSSAQTLTLSGIQAGDVVFFSHVSDNTNRNTLVSNTSDLSSWTIFIPDTFLTDAGGIASTIAPGKSIYYKVATGTSESINFTYIPSGDDREYLCVMFAVRGLNTTTPVVSPKMYVNSSSGTTLTAAARENPSYNTYNVVWHFHDDDEDAVLGQPTGYTEIIQQRSNTDTNDTGTLAISYIATTGGGSLPDRTFTSTQSDAAILIDAYLVPSGEDGTPPTITGSAEVTAAAGGTAVATYSASETVTWSLEGSDASLFSISSSGVVTYNSASVVGEYNIKIVGTDSSNLIGKLNVVVYAYVVGTSGGGISLVTSTSGATSQTANTTFSLTGIQSGDVVFLVGCSDSASASDMNFHASLEANGWTQETIQAYTGASPYISVWYKAATGTSESVTFVLDSSAGERLAISMSAWRGVDNTTPVLDVSGLATTFSGTTVTIPSFYVVSEGVALLIAGLDDDSTSVTTGPTGYTELVDQSAGSGSSSATLGMFYKNVVGNTTEAQTQVVFGSSDGHEGWTFLLNPD